KRAYCLKTQPATGETYPKSDLFNKAPSTCNFRRLAVTIYIGNYFLRVISVEWPPPNGEFLFFLAGNTLPLLKSF
ncbi:hypothetical protein OFN49_22855, partial [Escherichia coli]|uniref:hypothetical protein n=1 Tax=Escherichia coli TaxID=562 RepID=UPI001CF599E1